jgi:hypothetical protein
MKSDRSRYRGSPTPFVTIKRSGYEQYLGAQAANLCHRPTVIWEGEGDLSIVAANPARFHPMVTGYSAATNSSPILVRKYEWRSI